MEQEKRNKIMDTMIKIGEKVDSELDTNTQTREDIIYYDDFKFGKSGLAKKGVYIVKVNNQGQIENRDNTEENEQNQFTTYKLYDKNQRLIATVSRDGKIHFTQEYLEQLREVDAKYFEQLNLEDIDFALPEELEEKDIAITREELKEHENQRDIKGVKGIQKAKENLKSEEKETETEEEKKQNTAEALGIKAEEIKSICTINPTEKITDKHNLIDLMPEAAGYQEVSIVYSNQNDKSHGQFTILGVTKDGTREQINSIEPIEGTTSSKSVISVDENGSEVSEKQVKGLFRINSRGRNDGISVSIGDYGMMNVDYVSNIMDKNTRRATPIRTREAQNQRIPTYEVRENAGDSIEEVKKEGRIFRAREEEGVDPQSLDGIDIDKADGESMTLEELKRVIKDKALEQGDMSRDQIQEFIRAEISRSGLNLTQDETDMVVEEVREEVLDESRFPTRGHI